MNTIEISDVFRDYLKVIYNRFINKEEKWEFTQRMHEDPILYTSITFFNMQKELVDTPMQSLVFSDSWEVDSRKAFNHNLIKRKFPKALDNPVIGYYPPNGFVGWHTNHLAPGYIILFNWSEDGEGYFRYIKDNQMVTLKDDVGWSCKVGKFGDETDPLWHCARTDCRRFSFSYRFAEEKDWQDAVNLIKP
tara:strand:- start:52 stop:624 length:573 start_codon:yes stop_codon:yes gene_type:complete